MTKADARKVTVIEELLAQRLTVAQAAQLLGLSQRQVMRLKAEAAAQGAIAVLHKGRGRRPTNALPEALLGRIAGIYREALPGYNFSHAADVLSDEYGIEVSRSTVSRCLHKAGILSPKQKRRKKRHRARAARAHEGELVQMDASRFDWLSNGSLLHLHGAIDDATGKVLALHLEKEETFEGYCELMRQMNRNGHLPRQVYTDARSVFVYEKNKRKDLSIAEALAGVFEKTTQFARALQETGILLTIAGSPQAKGAIERLWETLQDRLKKDLCRHGVTGIDAANAYLSAFVPRYNQRFAMAASEPEPLYLEKMDPELLDLVFSRHETRRLDSGLSFSFQGQRYRLPRRADGKPVLVAPRDLITVAASRKIGLKVILGDVAVPPEPLPDRPQASVVTRSHHRQPLPTPVAPAKPQVSPWHGYTLRFYAENKRRDILADQLYAKADDIFPDH